MYRVLIELKWISELTVTKSHQSVLSAMLLQLCDRRNIEAPDN